VVQDILGEVEASPDNSPGLSGRAASAA
jgi:hypothetical protein